MKIIVYSYGYDVRMNYGVVIFIFFIFFFSSNKGRIINNDFDV